jgi:hypothetical protein
MVFGPVKFNAGGEVVPLVAEGKSLRIVSRSAVKRT